MRCPAVYVQQRIFDHFETHKYLKEKQKLQTAH